MTNLEEKIENYFRSKYGNIYTQVITIDETVVIITDKYEDYKQISSLIENEDIYEDICIEVAGIDDVCYCPCCQKYHWICDTIENNYRWLNEGWVCTDCLTNAETDNPALAEEYFYSLVNNPERANEFLSAEYLEDKGFHKLNTLFGQGLYTHSRQDNPREILDTLARQGHDVIFNIEKKNPFEVNFTVYIR